MRDADSRVEGRGYSLSSLRDSIRTRRDYVSPFQPEGSHGGLPYTGDPMGNPDTTTFGQHTTATEGSEVAEFENPG